MLDQDYYANFSIAAALAKFDIKISEVSSRDLVNDSRAVTPGDIFAAVTGTYLSGNSYIADAIVNGAVLVLAQCATPEQHGQIIAVSEQGKAAKIIKIYQLDKKLANLSAFYYNQPHQSLSLIGVTGTNGKTSCCQIMAQLLTAIKQPTAIIGTLGAGTLDNLVNINNTTPGPTKLQQLLAQFKGQDIKHVAMEVSSHALSQNRVDSKMIDIAVFTNLSRDHLDYHGDMASYSQAKQALFNGGAEQVWILNADDPQTSSWLDALPKSNRRVLFSCNEQAADLQADCEYVRASDIKCHQQGVSFKLLSSWGDTQINSALLGEFNVSNLLAALATLLVKGFSLAEISAHTESLVPVAGRMEKFSAENLPTAVVDYAHTPDGLEQALSSSRLHCHGQLWLVFGCGGDRDKGKRAIMGAIAEKFADRVIITNDNPRTEVPMQIAEDILTGFKSASNGEIILDRQQAVISALSRAKAKDMVLCAGKGHEDYLIIGEQKVAYHEREVVRKFYQGAINQ